MINSHRDKRPKKWWHISGETHVWTKGKVFKSTFVLGASEEAIDSLDVGNRQKPQGTLSWTAREGTYIYFTDYIDGNHVWD